MGKRHRQEFIEEKILIFKHMKTYEKILDLIHSKRVIRKMAIKYFVSLIR